MYYLMFDTLVQEGYKLALIFKLGVKPFSFSLKAGPVSKLNNRKCCICCALCYQQKKPEVMNKDVAEDYLAPVLACYPFCSKWGGKRKENNLVHYPKTFWFYPLARHTRIDYIIRVLQWRHCFACRCFQRFSQISKKRQGRA